MKQFVFSLFVLFSCALSALAQTDSLLTVKVTGVPSSEGHILIALYDNADDWTKPEVAKYTRKEPASKGAMLIDFAHLAPGKYSAAILHDADDSQGMTFGNFGLPVEEYGFSNNARGLLGAPSFEDCLFEFKRSGMITIEVK